MVYENKTIQDKFPSISSKKKMFTVHNKCPYKSTDIIQEPTQAQIDLVRTSWQKVTEIRHEYDDRNISPSSAFGTLFYDTLFEMNVECKHFFGNVFQQAKAFTGIISYITRAPHIHQDTTMTIRDINAKKRDNITIRECDPEWFALQMKDLGAKHYFYKVQPHHFDLVGHALVIALKKRLENEYTEEIGDAWIKTTCYAAYHMKIGYEAQRVWEEENKKIKSPCIIQ